MSDPAPSAPLSAFQASLLDACEDGEWQWGKATATARALAGLESQLRCGICSELFNIPVLLRECGHSFCSACIRQALGFKLFCPTCRMPAGLGDIQKNPCLETITQHFVGIRPAVLAEVISMNAPPAEIPSKNKVISAFVSVDTHYIPFSGASWLRALFW
jgi:hypothetical protein